MALFGGNKSQNTSTDNAPMGGPHQVNFISAGTIIEGAVNAEHDVRVSGTIKGDLNVEGKAILTPEGEVEGEIRAANGDVAGRVQGNIHIEGLLVLRRTARIEADIKTARVVVEDGAMFNGVCDMGHLKAVKPLLRAADSKLQAAS